MASNTNTCTRVSDIADGTIKAMFSIRIRNDAPQQNTISAHRSPLIGRLFGISQFGHVARS